MFGLARERSRPPVVCRQRSPKLPTSETTMMSVSHASTRAALALVLASVSWSAGAAAQGLRSALDPITSAVINHPITTSSAEARAHFLEGLREFDLGRLIDANVHFKAAVAADPDFAFAYLNVANTANSLDEFKTSLALAEQNAARASEAERLQIQMTRKDFNNDLPGQLALGQQLVAKYPQSPRAWLALAGAQGALNENVDARESMAKALELSPKLYVAHVIMGNNYIFGEPRDFTKALRHMQEAEALAPDESNAHMFVGDAYRAQKNLAKAREEYLRGHALEPRNAVLLVKAGHANTFLGDYAAARANVVVIATHTKNRAAVEQALKQLEPLLMQQADEAGNPAFTRGQQAQIAYLEGWWAARRGDYQAAQTQADRISQLLEPDANPRKLEPMHQLKGFIALYQGKYQEAAGHLRQGNPFDPYVKYQLAVATEGAGDEAQAKKLFREIADYNFNALGFALVRKEAQQKAGRSAL